jgi:hypothetical protein
VQAEPNYSEFGNHTGRRHFFGTARKLLGQRTVRFVSELCSPKSKLASSIGFFRRNTAASTAPLGDILFRHNAMDLDGKRNTGEYDPEIHALLSRIHEPEHLNTIQDFLFGSFQTDFGRGEL